MLFFCPSSFSSFFSLSQTLSLTLFLNGCLLILFRDKLLGGMLICTFLENDYTFDTQTDKHETFGITLQV